MSQENSTPASAPSSAPAGKKKANRNRAKARAQFDASATPISLERFFSGFQEVKRSNVDVELDPELLSRVAAPYVDKASDYADIADLDPDTVKPNLQQTTFALVGLTLIRKLIKSVPASVLPAIAPLKYVSDMDLHAPPALCTAFENIGKVSTDDFTLRLKYHEQDIVRNIFRVLKIMSNHTNFVDRYAHPPGQPWETINPERVIIASRGSARWLRDLGDEFLAETVYQTFPAVVQINGNAVEVQVTFPKLRLSFDRDVMLRNIVAWIALLNPELPNVHLLIAAAVFQIVTPQMLERPTTAMRFLEPALANTWIANRSLASYLDEANVVLVTMRTRDVARSGWFRFFEDVHGYVSNHGRSIFDKFFKLTKQPDNPYGTTAQMLEMDWRAWVEQESRTIPGSRFLTQRTDMSAKTITKLTDKGAVTSGLTFGFAKSVEYHNAYSARLNGNPSAIRLQYVSTDFLNIG